MNLPTTLTAAHALIVRLERELIKLQTQIASRGEAAGLLRDPDNFQKIDDVLEKIKDRPFKITELFSLWLKEVALDDIDQKIKSSMLQHFRTLLEKNSIVTKVGGQGRSSLWRASPTYNYFLRNTDELCWRTLETDQGTYLIPKQ